jgi:hypothetical protein
MVPGTEYIPRDGVFNPCLRCLIIFSGLFYDECSGRLMSWVQIPVEATVTVTKSKGHFFKDTMKIVLE